MPTIGNQHVAVQPLNQADENRKVEQPKTSIYNGRNVVLEGTTQTAAAHCAQSPKTANTSPARDLFSEKSAAAYRQFLNTHSVALINLQVPLFPSFDDSKASLKALIDSTNHFDDLFKTVFKAAYTLQGTDLSESEALKSAGKMAKEIATNRFMKSKNPDRKKYAELMTQFEQTVEETTSPYAKHTHRHISYRFIPTAGKDTSAKAALTEAPALAAEAITQEPPSTSAMHIPATKSPGKSQYGAELKQSPYKRFQTNCADARQTVEQTHREHFSESPEALTASALDFDMAFRDAFKQPYIDARQNGGTQSEARTSAHAVAQKSAIGQFQLSENPAHQAYAQLMEKFGPKVSEVPPATLTEAPAPSIAETAPNKTSQPSITTPQSPTDSVSVRAQYTPQSVSPERSWAGVVKGEAAQTMSQAFLRPHFEQMAKRFEEDRFRKALQSGQPVQETIVLETSLPVTSREAKQAPRTVRSWFTSSKQTSVRKLAMTIGRQIKGRVSSHDFKRAQKKMDKMTDDVQLVGKFRLPNT
jgi:hypothetical protein